MRIAFYDTSNLYYSPETPYIQPLGGTQSAACYLAAALADQGLDVTLVSKSGNGEIVRGVYCWSRTYFNTADSFDNFDIVVALTSAIGGQLRTAGVKTKLVNWQHKTPFVQSLSRFEQPSERSAWDGVVYVSEWQRNEFDKKFGLPGSVIRNATSTAGRYDSFGAKRTFIERGDDPVIVYASAPGRGLDLILLSMPTIRSLVPNATLKVFSDQAMYQNSQNDEFEPYYNMAKSLPGVDYYGTVSQVRLAEELFSADLWVYPTIFVETSCIVMMEAALAGCSLIASDIGALKETGLGYCEMLKSVSGRAELCTEVANSVLDIVEKARNNPIAFKEKIEIQRNSFKESNWNVRALEWNKYLSEMNDH